MIKEIQVENCVICEPGLLPFRLSKIAFDEWIARMAKIVAKSSTY